MEHTQQTQGEPSHSQIEGGRQEESKLLERQQEEEHSIFNNQSNFDVFRQNISEDSVVKPQLKERSRLNLQNENREIQISPNIESIKRKQYNSEQCMSSSSSQGSQMDNHANIEQMIGNLILDDPQELDNGKRPSLTHGGKSMGDNQVNSNAQNPYESIFQNNLMIDPVLSAGDTTGILLENNKKRASNSKSLLNGQIPSRTPTRFNHQGAGGYDSDFSHPYNATNNTGTLGESKKHQKSCDLNLPNLSDGEEAPSSSKVRNTQFQPEFIGSNFQGASMGGFFSSSYNPSHNQNQSQTAVDDKNSHKSWIDSNYSDPQNPAIQNLQYFQSPPQSAIHDSYFGTYYNAQQAYAQPNNINMGRGGSVQFKNNGLIQSQSIFNTNFGQPIMPEMSGQIHYERSSVQGSANQHPHPLVIAPPRANSFDRAAQQNLHQQQFASGGPGVPSDLRMEETDIHSTMSVGKCSAFSEGDIYSTTGQAREGTLGNINSALFLQNSNNPQLIGGFQAPTNIQNTQNFYQFTPNQGYSNPQQYYQSFQHQAAQMQSNMVIPSQPFYPQNNHNRFEFMSPQSGLSQLSQRGCISQDHQQEFIHQFEENKKGEYFQVNPGMGGTVQRQMMKNTNAASPYRHSDGAFHSQNMNNNSYVGMASRGNKSVGGSFNPEQFMNSPPHNQGQINTNQHRHSAQNQKGYQKGQMYIAGQPSAKIGLLPPPFIQGKIDFNHHEQTTFMQGVPVTAREPNPHFQQIYTINQRIHNSHQVQANLIPRTPNKGGVKSASASQSGYKGQHDLNVSSVPQHQTHIKSTHSQHSGGEKADHTTTDAFSKNFIQQYESQATPDEKLEFLRPHIYRLSLEQTGSRFLQTILQKGQNKMVEFFLDETEEKFWEIMNDNYGNYFCQILLQASIPIQRLRILKAIESRFIQICCNVRGTHTIQSMFDIINMPEEVDLINRALKGKILQLSLDTQGHHVVKKLLLTYFQSKRYFIFDEVYENFVQIAKNSSGLCVVKDLIAKFNPQEIQKKDLNEFYMNKSHRLLQIMHDNIYDLAQDPFGNYAITEIIQTWHISFCKPLFDALRARIFNLGSQKFSSPVIEKCIERSDKETFRQFIQELSGSESLTGLVKNNFGNYVVQRALRQAKDDQELLYQLIQPIQKRLPDIQDKKLRGKWEQILEDAKSGRLTAPSKAQESMKEHQGSPNGSVHSSGSAQPLQPQIKSEEVKKPGLTKPPRGGNKKHTAIIQKANMKPASSVLSQIHDPQYVPETPITDKQMPIQQQPIEIPTFGINNQQPEQPRKIIMGNNKKKNGQNSTNIGTQQQYVMKQAPNNNNKSRMSPQDVSLIASMGREVLLMASTTSSHHTRYLSLLYQMRGESDGESKSLVRL